MEKSGKKKQVVPPFARPMTQEEFVQQIKEAEKGPFYTSTEAKELLKKWRSKRA